MKKGYIEILLLILISCSPLLSQSIKGFIMIFILSFNVKYFKIRNRRQYIYIYISVVYFLFFGLIDVRNISSNEAYSILNFYYPLSFFSGYVISRKYEFIDFFKIFERIIFVSAIFSIIGMLAYTFLPYIISSLPTYNYYGTTHKTALFFNVLIGDNGIIARNTGIASEPGLYQLFLNLALYSHIKYSENENFLKILIYGIAILGTHSTTGLIIFMFLVWQTVKKYKYSGVLIFILSIVFLETFYNEAIYQFNNKFIGSSSFELRIKPMFKAFNEGKNHVFGLGNTGYNTKYINLGVGSYDSFSQVFIRYGIIGLLVLVTLLLLVFINDLYLFLIIFLTFFSQPIWFAPIIMPFYFYSQKKIKFRRIF